MHKTSPSFLFLEYIIQTENRYPSPYNANIAALVNQENQTPLIINLALRVNDANPCRKEPFCFCAAPHESEENCLALNLRESGFISLPCLEADYSQSLLAFCLRNSKSLCRATVAV
jgi:hypothetical protein